MTDMQDEPTQCPNCHKWFKQKPGPPMGCFVTHPPGGCCHYNQIEVPDNPKGTNNVPKTTTIYDNVPGAKKLYAAPDQVRDKLRQQVERLIIENRNSLNDPTTNEPYDIKGIANDVIELIDNRCNEAVVKELKDMLDGFTLGFAKINDPEFMEMMQPILNVLSDRIAALTAEEESKK